MGTLCTQNMYVFFWFKKTQFLPQICLHSLAFLYPDISSTNSTHLLKRFASHSSMKLFLTNSLRKNTVFAHYKKLIILLQKLSSLCCSKTIMKQKTHEGKFSIKENFEKQSSLMNFELLSWQSYICYWHSTQTFIPPYSVQKSCWNFQFVTIGHSAKRKTWMSIALVSKPGHWMESSGMTSKGIWAYLWPRP